MELIAFLFATIYFTYSVVRSSSLCSNVTPTHLNLIYTGFQDIHDVYSLHECVKMCRSLTRCKAFNYNQKLSRCLIQHVDSSTYKPSLLLSFPPMVFYDKVAWNMGPCSVHNCAANESCYPTGASYVCKKAIDVCFNQVPVDVCFRRYEGVTMLTSAANYNMGDTIAHTLAECVIFCNIHHPTYKMLYFSLNSNQCYCRNISVAEYEQQGGRFKWSYGDTYEKIN